MLADLSQFREVFFEESAEHLSAVESALLSLETAREDRPLLDAIFRGVHSIKGSGGMLGLDGVVGFAHSFETLLSHVREGAIGVTDDLLDLSLRSTDMLREVVLSARDGAAPPADAEGLRREVDRFAAERRETAGSSKGGPGGLDALGAALRDAVPENAGPRGAARWTIRFEPAADVFQCGADPALILRDLARLGELPQVRLDTSKLPAFGGIDPESCFVAWDMVLVTAATRDEILDVFAFVEDGARIYLTAETPEIPAEAEKAAELEKAPELEKASGVRAAAPAGGGGGGEGSSIRVSTAKIDELMDLVGELVIAQSIVGEALKTFTPEKLEGLTEAFQQMERSMRELQERVMAVRMLPIGGVFSRFGRLVRDLANTTGKQISLDIKGEGTELDKGVIERLADPLTHLVRNSADHGLETPADRKAAGKPEVGTIGLNAYHEGGSVVVEVSDDGRGLNAGRIREKAIQLGFMRADEPFTDDRMQEMIFKPGFSTAQKVTDLSGRGVGMDVLASNVKALNGTIGLETKAGRGTVVRIRLPLTLAILDGLLMRVGGQSFVLPLLSILESIRPKRDQVRMLAGKREVILLRGEAIPLLRLAAMFGIPDAVDDPCQGSVVILEDTSGQHRVRTALLVDELMGQRQVVIKSLEKHFRKLEGIMGATILGDGRAALIVDPAGAVGLAMRGPGDLKKAS